MRQITLMERKSGLFSQVNGNVSIDDYLNVDDQVLTSQMLSDEEIVASVRSSAEE